MVTRTCSLFFSRRARLQSNPPHLRSLCLRRNALLLTFLKVLALRRYRHFQAGIAYQRQRIMPTKRLSKERHRELMEKHKIKFEGPIPPQKWPLKQKHLFTAIRDIWAVRYDEHMTDSSRDPETRSVTQERVTRLRETAYELRQNIKTTENTWRFQIEPIVGERFKSKVLWSGLVSD